ncbi:MAG: hypothetical protein A3J76_03435 [Candidatus Moranbacteria bacterium RBG_13_45_13]|nr:MAG: hypothetical protein A3J76_03435 [Candidatus Moranbacteria bacterium RBG_13_45_13]
MLKIIKRGILDVLFPITCLNCQKDGFWLCEECKKNIAIQDFQLCPKCEKENTPSGFLCLACRLDRDFCLNALISATTYDAPSLKKLIYNFKYRFASSLSDILAQIILKALLSHNIPLPALIIPVPLHPKRLRWRGFNQAELLAENISRNISPLLEIPVLDILTRKKYNKPQVEIRSYRERQKNVSGLFALKPGLDSHLVKGKKILLVDDIATTGATLHECAKVLKAAGAKKVFAAVIARQTIVQK